MEPYRETTYSSYTQFTQYPADDGRSTWSTMPKQAHTSTYSALSDEQSQDTSYRNDIKGPFPAQSERTTKRSVFASWTFELFSIVFAMVLLVAIIILLSIYNGEKQPNWKYSINLNTIIALFSTILRASFVGAIEEVIAQLKWIWHKRPQPLKDLAAFDQASRGPWGSVMFFFRIRRIALAQIGCLLMVLSFTIGPFTQQAVRTTTCEKPLHGAQAALRIADTIPSNAVYRYAAGTWSVDSATKGAITYALANPTRNSTTVLLDGCTTGNCSFPVVDGISHSTIGVCSKCMDTTSFIKYYAQSSSGNASYLSLPSGTTLTQPPYGCLNSTLLAGKNNMDWALSKADDDFKATLSASFGNFSMLATTSVDCRTNEGAKDGDSAWQCDHKGMDFNDKNWSQFNLVSSTCTLYPCMRHFQAKVSGGIVEEKLVAEVPAPEIPNTGIVAPPYAALNGTCVIDGVRRNLYKAKEVTVKSDQSVTVSLEGKTINVPSECINRIMGQYGLALNNFIRAEVTGHCAMPLQSYPLSTARDERANVLCYPVATTNMQGAEWFWLSGLYNSGNATHDSITRGIAAMTDAISSRMRLIGVSARTNKSDAVYGTVHQTTVCTNVNWGWLSMPALLLAVGTVFFASTVIQSVVHRGEQPIWKSSILPLLYASQGSNIGRCAGSTEDLSEAANQSRVALVRRTDGWQFVKEQPEHA